MANSKYTRISSSTIEYRCNICNKSYVVKTGEDESVAQKSAEDCYDSHAERDPTWPVQVSYAPMTRYPVTMNARFKYTVGEGSSAEVKTASVTYKISRIRYLND